MSFDPRHEDYQRMGLRFARTLDETDPYGTVRAFSAFGRRFSQNRDSLPQSDGDRAFHLVAEATNLIDYQLPFVADEECLPMIERASRMLQEAIDLDAGCHDAHRMLAASTTSGFESYYRFLSDGAEAVLADCTRERDEARRLPGTNERRLGSELAMRPYVRWAAMRSAKALICGRYREALRLAFELLEMFPSDPADVRFTAALAYAKLEDEAGLDELERSMRARFAKRGTDAWMLLARIALARKSGSDRMARSFLLRLIETYPHAALTLFRQDELPDGVFSRLAVAPLSEDELILAVSEATVLLQEGIDSDERGPLGTWLAEQPEVALARAAAGKGKGAATGRSAR